MNSLFPHLDGVRPAGFASLQEQAEAAECYETPEWAARAILDVELMTERVWDPCCGTGVLSRAAVLAGYDVYSSDLYDWGCNLQDAAGADFLAATEAPFPETPWSAFLNPPFSRATDFVDQALRLGARKVLCFQRLAWRESGERAAWWAARPPARIWLCGSRATCWLFTTPPEERKGKSTPTAHAWFVWERGHKGAEVMGTIYKDGRA